MTHQEVKLNDSTPVPLSWVLKALGFVVLCAPGIWWAASLQTMVNTMAKAVEPIPAMAQQVAILADRAGISGSSTTGTVAIAPSMNGEDPDLLVMLRCNGLFGRGNAAHECIKTLKQ